MSVTVFLNYNMKNEILKLVQAGLAVKAYTKRKIASNFGSCLIYRFEDKFIVENEPKEFADLKEAVDRFVEIAFSPKNIGYIQQRIGRTVDLYDYDLEEPSEELKALFEEELKKVAKEYNEILAESYI